MARQYFASTLADSCGVIVPTTGSITTITGLFTPSQANQFFPMGYGLAAPFAGQVYSFEMGGIMTTGTASTILITPVWGPSTAQSGLTAAVSLGASAAQTYVASLTNVPWIMRGCVAIRSVSAVATASTVWCSGSFHSQGTLATAGSGLTVVFGSTAAVSVDTTGTAAAGSFGALNFGFTFGVASTVTCEWSSPLALN